MKLSIILITKNEEEMIEDCLKSAKGLGEIILIDDESEDKTREIAKRHKAKVFVQKRKSFADQRKFGLEKATGDWIFYLDADERMTLELRSEILFLINHQPSTINHQPLTIPAKGGSAPGGNHQLAAFLVKRRNFYLGKEMLTDKVHRLFQKDRLQGWRGEIHETPELEGETGELENYLIHLTHRDILSMLKKTAGWSEVEARLRLEADHPPVSWWRLWRVMVGEFWNQFDHKKIWRFGTEGWIEGIFQIFSLFVTYARLWEKQREESLKKTYARISQKIIEEIGN